MAAKSEMQEVKEIMFMGIISQINDSLAARNANPLTEQLESQV